MVNKVYVEIEPLYPRPPQDRVELFKNDNHVEVLRKINALLVKVGWRLQDCSSDLSDCQELKLVRTLGCTK